jgi:hypothetical protein
LYSIRTEFGVSMKSVRLINMRLNEAYSKVRKHLSDRVPTQNGLKQGDALLSLLLNFDLECAITSRKTKWD